MTTIGQGQNKDHIYVYFIENHIETSPSKVQISSDYTYGELTEEKK